MDNIRILLKCLETTSLKHLLSPQSLCNLVLLINTHQQKLDTIFFKTQECKIMHSKWCVTSCHKSKCAEQIFLQSFQTPYKGIIHELRKRRGLGKSFKLFLSILEIFHLKEKKCTQKTLLNSQSHEQELDSSQRNTFQEIYGFFSFPARPWGHREAVWHRLRDEGEPSENYFCSFFQFQILQSR